VCSLYIIELLRTGMQHNITITLAIPQSRPGNGYNWRRGRVVWLRVNKSLKNTARATDRSFGVSGVPILCLSIRRIPHFSYADYDMSKLEHVRSRPGNLTIQTQTHTHTHTERERESERGRKREQTTQEPSLHIIHV